MGCIFTNGNLERIFVILVLKFCCIFPMECILINKDEHFTGSKVIVKFTSLKNDHVLVLNTPINDYSPY